jgi:neutral ceramidase
MAINIGVARRSINPPRGIYLIGYGNRSKGNQGVHDDITATALAVDDGLHRAVIVACDLLAINEHTVARIQAQTGSNIVICCSHTHSGPITYAGQRSARRNREYIAYLVRQIVAAVNEAQAKRQPAALKWAEGEADISVNRRERRPDGRVEIGVNPDGPVDRSLGILQAQTAEGRVLASLVNYQCHGTVLGPKNMQVSADWIGVMRRNLEHESGAPVMFLQGATGDLNPEKLRGIDDFAATEALGSKVSGEAVKVLPMLAPVPGEAVSFHQEQVWLSLEAKAGGATPPPAYRAVLARMAHIPRFMVDTALNQRYPWKTYIAAREGYWSVPVVLTQIRLGMATIFTLGAEVFTEIGMAIKQTSPAMPTLFASVSSGCIGYIPTADEHALGGFEVDISPYTYRLPGRLNANSADKVMDAVRILSMV